MNLAKINDLLQTVANIGILAGLILVGVQINETNRITKAQFRSDDFSISIAGLDLKVADDLPEAWGRAAINSPDISDEDLIVIDAFMYREWYRVMQELNVSTRGFGELNLENGAVEWVFLLIGNETAYRWWTLHQNGILAIHTKLRDAVNERLAVLGESHTNYHKRGIDKLRNGPLFPSTVSDGFQ
jgi:hypothetical protein